MECHRAIVVWLLIMLWVSLASAVDIQFDLIPPNVVTGVSDFPIDPTIPGRGIVTLIGSAVDVIFPVPIGQPTNISCGVGQPEWTRITDPSGVTLAGAGMEVIGGSVFFNTTSTLLTGCRRVSSKHELNLLVDETIVVGVPDNPTTRAMNFHFGWYYGRCDDAPTNQNCIDWKTQLNILVSRYPGRAQGIAAATQAAILITDANLFLDQQCKATPGGPFC